MLKWLRRIFPVLFEDKMPVWLTIVASVAAAFATYYIAPSINRQFQLDDARAAQITKTIDGLNSEMIELSQEVRRLNSALINNPTEAPKIREGCLDLVTKLQWRLVDLRVVLTTSEDRAAITELAGALDTVKKELDRSVDARAQRHLLEAMRALAGNARDVLNRLYVTARLK